MKRKGLLSFWILSLLFTSSHFSFAQLEDFDAYGCALGKMKAGQGLLSSKSLRYPGDGSIDAGYYFLDLTIQPGTKNLIAKVQGSYKVVAPELSQFFLNLSSNLTVDSVLVNDEITAYTHAADRIEVDFSEPRIADDIFQCTVYYHGVPLQNDNSYSIEFDTHGSGEPVIWTLSEPYDAPLWWPCIDNQADKADSCDVWITLPEFFTSVSQGLLQEEVNNGDGTKTAKWKHRYPIAHYLISIAASNYTLQQRSYTSASGKTLPIDDYLYPEVAADANVNTLLNLTDDMMEVFSEKLGEYPFINEKYGHAMFEFGGGMEHQTISSMGGFTFGLIAHELAHQWYGNKVTCKTWRDIWINEGFAEFLNLYAIEQLIGKSTYDEQVARYMLNAKSVTGTVAIQNTNSVSAIFDFPKTYLKGSLILHTLRGIMGDDLFFAALKEFQNTEFAYGAASIEDFQLVAERVYGQSLQYYFDNWIFGTGYPQYTYGWEQSGETVMVEVTQSPLLGTQTFTYPIELELTFTDGSTEIQKVFVDQSSQSFELQTGGKELTKMTFDPYNYVMKEVSQVSLSPLSLSEFQQFKVYPNPSIDYLVLPEAEEVAELKVINQQGRVFEAPREGERLNTKYLPSGRYFVQFISNNGRSHSKSFVKI
ncbi:M1 family aminopeptidase [Jiulongibacter sp. NS-SX5]|uniref:M1 family aminopeptidase n=1 Tax=Jiulongibacter sp. NS-SX5 TaxID=3463854 RepID=UPI00405A170B